MLRADDIVSAGKPPRIAGLKATILGLARSGVAAAKLLKKQGAVVFASDGASTHDVRTAAAELESMGIPVEMGGHTARALECDYLVRSPGVPNSNPTLAEARRRGLAVVSEIEVAYWFCPAPVVAITGSNGKTTTAQWLGDAFRRAGRQVAVCGNVGCPFSAAVGELDSKGVAVVEVSSFQLEDIHLFSPRTAIITNFSPDHLDRYEDYDAYRQAKCRIFEKMRLEDALIYNRGDQELSRRVQVAGSRKISFGQDAPAGMGAGVVGDYTVLHDGQMARRLLRREDIALPGRHNLENALAVACAASDLKIGDWFIAESLRRFTGVPHRLEKVLESNGVLWVNDSKATNIASGIVGLGSFARPIVLLAGGRDKGSDFAAVAEQVAGLARQVILFGEAGPLMERAWSGKMEILRVSTLREAVQRASQEAHPGDVVLLSPMCASFDEFSNYEDRGEQFKKWVRSHV
jgi:UDP-N-acetylmuramoylalanine--D-glutamate ligase